MKAFDSQLEGTVGSHEGIQIIVAGLPRTGTLSMKLALEELGFRNCHHLLTPLFQSVWSTRVKESALAMATKDPYLRQFYLRRRFEGYDVVLDLPGSACVDDLIKMYPDAKV
ncbi:hypothetical protein BP6252_13149 [Coleophoma cylindrospora]|uniref:Uncharacterized protein n=1 Tax=Coleophoma cylindrospora TaxID=1849047 RepID=A0A3D8QA04_9HELO|nr:hypothetical protein BP6252_13149 [Coleophoma cylindrospora]